MAPPRPLRRLVAVLSLWLVLFAGVMTAACSMAPRDETPDPRSDHCGETGVCEGSVGHPGCDVPGVVVFDLDGRPVCEGS